MVLYGGVWLSYMDGKPRGHEGGTWGDSMNLVSNYPLLGKLFAVSSESTCSFGHTGLLYEKEIQRATVL